MGDRWQLLHMSFTSLSCLFVILNVSSQLCNPRIEGWWREVGCVCFHFHRGGRHSTWAMSFIHMITSFIKFANRLQYQTSFDLIVLIVALAPIFQLNRGKLSDSLKGVWSLGDIMICDTPVYISFILLYDWPRVHLVEDELGKRRHSLPQLSCDV